MKKILPTLFLSFAAFAVFTGYTDEEALAKKKAADDYRDNIVATTISTPEQIGWTGKEKSCKPGKVSHDTYVKIIARINYFRRLAGVNDKVVLDSGWNKYAQAAALIMLANNELNHHPNPGMKCYSEDGKTGASTSNLSSFNATTVTELINDEIQDGGESNKDCGHRRWLLNSTATKFGFGATTGSYAVRDFAPYEEHDTSVYHGKVPEYFGYPFQGYVPYQVIYPKWSFAVTGTADFSVATVEVKAGDKLIPATVISRGKENYGDPTIVWEIKGMKEDFYYQSLDASGTFWHYYDMTEKRKVFEKLGLMNKKITVKVSNVKVGGKMKTYTYFFTVFDANDNK